MIIIYWVNLISHFIFCFVESKRNVAFDLAGDTIVELMSISCLDGK